jgi:succinate dehydrogenase flavin-adding protein (antitoxin of CptAB toxin-antitoxin module)
LQVRKVKKYIAMIKIISFLVFVGFGYSAQAQSTTAGSSSSDTTHRHKGYSQWRRSNDQDSTHKRPFHEYESYGRTRWREMASNSRFHGRGEMGNRHRFGKEGRDGRNRGNFGIHYSPEQRKQLMAINAEYNKKRSDLYKNDNLTLREYKAGLVSLAKDKKSKLENLLTQDQKNKIAEFKKKRDEDRQVRAAAHLERMKIRLNLTDQQTASIKSHEQSMATQIRSIRENDNLLSYQKRDQIKQLAEKQKDELKSILTPEQLSQLENMHKQRFAGK